MRKVILNLAVSLDGFIEGSNGEIDWCFNDQDYGMSDLFNRIDSLFMGRKSYELYLSMGGSATAGFPKLKEYVFSNTLKDLQPKAILIDGDIEAEVKRIKKEQGKDIWLFGGSSLTTSLLGLDLIDELNLAVHPVILGGGKHLFQEVNDRINLELVDTRTYSTGLILVRYHLK